MNPIYATLYLASLALFFVLLCVVAGDRQRSSLLARFGAAAAFALLIPVVLIWSLPPTLVALSATVIVGALVARDVIRHPLKEMS
ncbi:hypothetical protein GCM10007160_37860 [Litchfieldella qijiaojingensis]|uniref:Uncharacterized protein n=2 Tax=Litchfieldella qijiaojingensis TaxID=980347 RepID=A0ABQ2ZA12_9GAMM|nr:hypothetical protein GCM10007160_37860 [Halomonas qijiaojingensis]